MSLCMLHIKLNAPSRKGFECENVICHINPLYWQPYAFTVFIIQSWLPCFCINWCLIHYFVVPYLNLLIKQPPHSMCISLYHTQLVWKSFTVFVSTLMTWLAAQNCELFKMWHFLRLWLIKTFLCVIHANGYSRHFLSSVYPVFL